MIIPVSFGNSFSENLFSFWIYLSSKEFNYESMPRAHMEYLAQINALSLMEY
jgi:hypothetical protein